MVNLQGDAATRFDVIVELLELFEDMDVADAIDASVYIIDGASADAEALEYAERKAVEPDAYDDDRCTLDEAIVRFGFDRSRLEDEIARDAAKAAHPSNREPALEQQPAWVRGLTYDRLASTLAEGYQDDEAAS